MTGPRLALAASAREWPDRLHRFLLDHGGGRVRSRVMSPDQAIADEYDVLFIDDICSFLTPRLVRRLRLQQKELVGVFSPDDEPDAKRRLIECGIPDVIEEDASSEEFILAAAILVDSPLEPDVSPSLQSGAVRIGVAGSPGSGVTEVAVGLARALADLDDVLLIDLDLRRPSIAHRLDLDPLPSLRTAIDLALHEPDRVHEAIQGAEGLRVVAGLTPTDERPDSLAADRIESLIQDLGSRGLRFVVADLGEMPGPIPLHDLDVLLLVGIGNPVGIARLMREAIRACASATNMLLVVNAIPGGRRGDEVRRALATAFPGVPTAVLPKDRTVESASWNGAHVPSRARFSRRLGRVAGVVARGMSK